MKAKGISVLLLTAAVITASAMPITAGEMSASEGSGAVLDYSEIYGGILDELQDVLLEGQPRYNGYELYDLNQDGVKELLIYESGDVNFAQATLTVLSYDGNNVVEWGEIPSHSGWYWLLGESIISSSTGMRGLSAAKYTYQDGEFKAEVIYGPDDGYGPGLESVPEMQDAVELEFPTHDLSDRSKLKEG